MRVYPGYLLVRLREDEVRDQDVKERLHFNQGEALAYAGLQQEMRLSDAPHGHVKCEKKRTRGPAENVDMLE